MLGVPRPNGRITELPLYIFEWTAQQVANLGGNKGVVYIVADGKLDVQELEVYCNCNLVLGSMGTEFCLLLVINFSVMLCS